MKGREQGVQVMREAPAVQSVDMRATGRLVVRWEIGGGASWLEVGIAVSGHWGGAMRVDGVEGALISGDEVRAIEFESGAGSWVQDGELVHIDVPGAVQVTVRGELELGRETLAGEGPLRVMYARTTALERLGIEGGRYEVVGCRVERL
jgi:hypothetical protein